MDLTPLIKNKIIKKILVARRDSLGDTLIATPLLRAIKETFPHSKTIVLASPAAKDILEGHPFVDELLLYDKGYPILPIIKKIWRSDFALIVDLHYRSSLFAWLAGIPIRIGRGSKKKSFITHQLPFMTQDIRATDEVLELGRVLGINTENHQLVMPPVKESEKRNAEKILSDNEIDFKKDKLVVLSPYSLGDTKDWPEENYQQVISFLNLHDCKPIIISGRENYTRAASFNGSYNFAGKLNLRETVYLIQMAKLVICGCSSALHFTATTSTPSIAIYGPSNPKKWAPLQNCTVISKFFDCSPCYGIKACERDKECIRLITPQEIIKEIVRILEIKKYIL
jgi:ADP-heptose:LPS heptosyltransferase